ncbi:MAG: GNAT family N-acetyltransferase [Proteobacteria bacterium]|nr:GNAT family N-acetyltransferase [Pseudomonadota bacterium]
MDTVPSLHDYGSLLLGSRLRKVSETLYAGVDTVYREAGVALPSRCFPILFLLRDRGRLGISELAALLGQSHPAVSQMSRKLLRHRVVREWPDPADDRRRLLGLSRRGAGLMRRLEPLWGAIVATVAELEAAQPLSGPLTAMDTALATRSFAARIRAHADGVRAVQILSYTPRYAADFKRLNLEWVQKFFRVEPVDVKVLSRPQRIIDGGGAICFARRDGRIVGTCALIHDGDGVYELSKMAVTADCQGLGIGRKLLEAMIAAFRARHGRTLYLETNSILKPAIKLYESVGFEHTPPPHPSAYERADVYMVHRDKPKA